MAYCDWDRSLEIARRYHDEEWGVPVFDDRKQFEHLMMEVMQCGLSWDLMMKKRGIFRECFLEFDFEKVAKFDDSDVERILNVPGMIRSPRKVWAVINNAQKFLKIREEFGSFSKFIWGFAGGKPIIYEGHPEGYIPVSNGLSARLSAELKRRGFKYMGPIVVYSHMQSVGIINDHAAECPRFREIGTEFPGVKVEREEEVGVRFYGEND